MNNRRRKNIVPPPWQPIGDNSDLSDQERSLLSIMGVIRFDAKAVANALRSRPLTVLEAHGLANLIEGKHPQGISLKVLGQGRNWQPIREGSQRYNRAIAIAREVRKAMGAGETWESAIQAAAEHFRASEATIARNVALARSIQGIENT